MIQFGYLGGTTLHDNHGEHGRLNMFFFCLGFLLFFCVLEFRGVRRQNWWLFFVSVIIFSPHGHDLKPHSFYEHWSFGGRLQFLDSCILQRFFSQYADPLWKLQFSSVWQDSWTWLLLWKQFLSPFFLGKPTSATCTQLNMNIWLIRLNFMGKTMSLYQRSVWVALACLRLYCLLASII